MADNPKEIKIHIATTGAEEAATGIRTVTDATGELDDSAQKSTDSADDLSRSVGDIATIQKAKAAAEFAGIVGEIGRQLILAADDAEAFDADFAASMRSAGESIEEVSSKASNMAQAFAVGGPIAAGLALNADLLKDATVEWFQMSSALEKAALAQAQADAMQTRLNLALAGIEDPALLANDLSQQLAESYTAETAALDALVDATGRRNQILDAKDKTAAAARDNADAEAIRNGAAPEDVKAQRAIDDAAVEKARIDRELELKNARERALREEADRQRAGQLELSSLPGADAVQIDEAKKRADAARAAAEKAELDRITFEQVAGERKATIDIKAEGKVSGFSSDKENRLLRELEANAREQDRQDEEARLAKERAARAAGADEQAGIRRSGREAKIGQDAVALLPDGVKEGFRRAVEDVSRRLQDGDQGGEVAEISKLLQELASASRVKGTETERQIMAARRDIELLKSQIKHGKEGR